MQERNYGHSDIARLTAMINDMRQDNIPVTAWDAMDLVTIGRAKLMIICDMAEELLVVQGKLDNTIP